MEYRQARDILIQTLFPALGEEAFPEAKFLLDGVTKGLRRPLTEEEGELLLSQARRRLEGEPLQYILGEWEFMGLPMEVSPGVLIPRPETELLCETALKELPRGARVLDLCCGTGCIGIAMGKLGDMQVTFCDISPAALTIARRNARRNGVAGEFVQGDFFALLTGRTFDGILCNPPYLTEGEMAHLQRELTYEPALALYGGEDGLDFYRRLRREAALHLQDGGRLYMEIGCSQGQAVQAMFPGSEILQDLSGLDRLVLWTKRE